MQILTDGQHEQLPSSHIQACGNLNWVKHGLSIFALGLRVPTLGFTQAHFNQAHQRILMETASG
jgi:hypothetical protein